MTTLEQIREEYENNADKRDGRPFESFEGITQSTNGTLAGINTAIERTTSGIEGSAPTTERGDRGDGRTSETDRAGNGVPHQVSRGGETSTRARKPRGINSRASQQEIHERVNQQPESNVSPPLSKKRLKLPSMEQVRKTAFPRLTRSSRPFSQKEASEKRDRLIEVIEAESGYMDEFLHITNRKNVHPVLWSMDAEEAGVIADMLLKRAQKSARAAAVVNSLIDFYENAQVFVVLGPRLWGTYVFYRMNGIGFKE